ncbi:hypothetical protein [Actinoplanes sp. N902-109]|uniref:hypothetical protein n=1 Tax=Actinoplanes sp. (strain N902-109) TaxID=649831 RepID=UPI000329663D|nr:hypothetical protein [Actinoplanes sp. N902-109]AGL14497.1 hypothetical protein L083_0987 [Actinoplanes sp. N902-109]
MSSVLEVDPAELRLWALELRRTGARVTLGPLPPVAGPPWSSTAAEAGAAEAARRMLTGLVRDLDAIGQAADAAADDYEGADARVAARLRSIQ